MRISDWSSDVCSSDLKDLAPLMWDRIIGRPGCAPDFGRHTSVAPSSMTRSHASGVGTADLKSIAQCRHSSSETPCDGSGIRSEEHTSELQSLMRISYAVIFLKKKKQ